MKNCIGFTEKLSAYYDGELSASEAADVKEHIATCDSCSALLEMYKEISIVSDSENVPVPDALRIGVMNTLKAEDLYGPKKAKKEERPTMRLILTRYMPIAACLVVVFFVWSFWGNTFGVRNDTASPASQNVPHEAAIMMDSDLGLYSASASDAGFSDSADSSTFSDDNLGGGDTRRSADPEGSTNTPSATPVPSNFPEELIFRDLFDSSMTADEIENIRNYITGASFWITYTGDLPDHIIAIFPQSLGPWFGWDIIFELPTEDVEFLLDNISTSQIRDDMTGFSVTENESRPVSPYAVVFYSFGE